MKTLVAIPTYNEVENIGDLIHLIRDYVKDEHLEILVIDSASPDGTADVVRSLQSNDVRLHLLGQPRKLGLGKAYLDGMSWALRRNYDIFITMDADFSHHPNYINTMLTALSEEKDLVIGSRYISGGGLKSWPFYRRCLSRFANWYARTLIGLPFYDLTSGFNAFRIRLLERIIKNPIETEGYAFLIELKFRALQMGARVGEIPIVFTDRTRGYSKISKKVIWESMQFVWKLALKVRLGSCAHSTHPS